MTLRSGFSFSLIMIFWVALALSLLFTAPAPAGRAVLDGGTLDPEWFGGEREFRRTSSTDYLWVKPGFSIDDHAFHFEAWPLICIPQGTDI